MQTMLVHLFGHSIFLLRKLTFDELKVAIKECQHLMLFVLRHIPGETKKHGIGVFPNVEVDDTSHIVNQTYTTLDWYCCDGCKTFY